MTEATRPPEAGRADSLYVHGTAPEEQRRLTRLNELLNRRSLDALELRGDERVLDVGAGLGQLSRAMARSGATVVGIERSEAQIAEAWRQAREAGETERLELRQGDALELPLEAAEWGAFDVAHTRFLLEHVSDPLAVVRQMVLAVRPGGRIVLEDDDHDLLRLWPEPPGVETLWRAYMRIYDRLGNDPFVGRRLVSLLHEAGAQPVRNQLIFFGACAGDGNFPWFALNLIEILLGAETAIRETGGIDQQTFDSAIESIRTWSKRPDAAFWYAMSWAEGRRES